MRSRYTAFALGRADYLLTSWDPSTLPRDFALDGDTVWRKLQIVDTEAGGASDDSGVVEFRASYRAPDGGGLMHERSRFVRHDGRWVYLDGEALGPS